MSMEVLAAELLALDSVDPAQPAATSESTAAPPLGGDCSAESLALVLARAAERVRSDPDANFAHCAVRGAAEVLRARLDERMGISPGAARDATEEP